MREIPGVNIQWPWSELILKGTKTVETRNYPLPERLHGVELAIIQTPGPEGRRLGMKAEITGTVIFGLSYKYRNLNHWKSEKDLHLVEPDNEQFRFRHGSPKWAWKIKSAKALPTPVDAPEKKGIKFTLACKLP